MLGKTYTAVDVGVIHGVPDITALFFFFAAIGAGHMIKFLPNICQGKPQPRLLKELNTGQLGRARSDSSEREREKTGKEVWKEMWWRKHTSRGRRKDGHMMGLMWLSECKTCSASGSVFNYRRQRCRSAFSIHQSQHRSNAAHHRVSCRARISEKQQNETSFNLCGGTCVIRVAVHHDDGEFIRRKSTKIFTDTSDLNGVFIGSFCYFDRKRNTTWINIASVSCTVTCRTQTIEAGR